MVRSSSLKSAGVVGCWPLGGFRLRSLVHRRSGSVVLMEAELQPAHLEVFAMARLRLPARAGQGRLNHLPMLPRGLLQGVGLGVESSPGSWNVAATLLDPGRCGAGRRIVQDGNTSRGRCPPVSTLD